VLIYIAITHSQHYEWLIPAYYKNPEKDQAEIQVLYLEARTVTVMRTLVPNTELIEFGEIPVALRKVSIIDLMYSRLKKC